jgi:hypothetical protein
MERGAEALVGARGGAVRGLTWARRSAAPT